MIVNKIDDKSRLSKTLDFFELGLGEPYAVSAMNNSGVERLLDETSAHMEKSVTADTGRKVKVAIVGRPNVGKSSYLNAILREERAIVHHLAGSAARRLVSRRDAPVTVVVP